MKKSKYGTWEDPVLIWIAEHSPKAYALQIRKRNQRLLAAIKKRPRDDYSGTVGCPHCKPQHDTGACQTANCTGACLWRKADHAVLGKDRYFACCETLFAGHELCSPELIGLVRYGAQTERYLGMSYGPVTDKNLTAAIEFLEAHVEWTKYPEWGRLAKPTVKVGAG